MDRFLKYSVQDIKMNFFVKTNAYKHSKSNINIDIFVT